MPKRLLILCLLATLSALSTGCCGRIRQCIANRWHANHQYGGGGGGYGGGAACCTPAFKVPAQYGASVGGGCASCGSEAPGMVYQGAPVHMQAPPGTPNIGYPMPLLGTGSEKVPGTMPPKN